MTSPFFAEYHSTVVFSRRLQAFGHIVVNADSRTVAEKLQASCGNQ
jgi:hypothetical protein